MPVEYATSAPWLGRLPREFGTTASTGRGSDRTDLNVRPGAGRTPPDFTGNGGVSLGPAVPVAGRRVLERNAQNVMA